jgi:hypothetical protein
VLIRIWPYAEMPDTESVCFVMKSLLDSITQEHCIPLYVHAASSPMVDSVLFTLDTTPVRYQFGQKFKTDTVRGYMQNLTADSVSIGFEETHAPPNQTPNWVIRTVISGNTIFAGDELTIKIASNVTLPVLIIILLYPEVPADTETECFTLTSLHDSGEQELCIPLYFYMPAASSVSRNEASSNSLALYPNPASSTIQVICQQSISSFYLLDLLGRRVLSSRIAGNDVLDVSELQPGRYEAVVYTESGIVTASVIIQR